MCRECRRSLFRSFVWRAPLRFSAATEVPEDHQKTDKFDICDCRIGYIQRIRPLQLRAAFVLGAYKAALRLLSAVRCGGLVRAAPGGPAAGASWSSAATS